MIGTARLLFGTASGNRFPVRITPRCCRSLPNCLTRGRLRSSDCCRTNDPWYSLWHVLPTGLKRRRSTRLTNSTRHDATANSVTGHPSGGRTAGWASRPDRRACAPATKNGPESPVFPHETQRALSNAQASPRRVKGASNRLLVPRDRRRDSRPCRRTARRIP